MGTPDFAVASLDALVKAGCNIVGVITAPDKPAGRGMKLNESAVKKYAVEHNLNILQPEKLKNAEFLEQLKALNADLQIVVAFRMLPEVVWNMPPMGTVNLHGSLLPQYRGAAPINIDENETAGEVHDKMKEIGAALLVKTVEGLADRSLNEVPQLSMVNGQWSMEKEDGNSPFTIHHSLKHAPKIFTDTCKIDFTKTTTEVHNLIRGLSPFPGAFTYLDARLNDEVGQGKMLKIYRSKKEITSSKSNTGEFETDNKTFLKFACADGYVHVIELQLEGKKKMNVEDFLRGYRFQ
ncbi:MAG: methionyl-tRNA formyltransferase [Sphingobacteriales bacterium]|nr:methionyl-tRNA formyltransferase [Sphingobacteriales bacterium]